MIKRFPQLTCILSFLTLLCIFSPAHATTNHGYTGTTANDGTKLNGLAGAPFTAGCSAQTYNGNLYCSRTDIALNSKGLPLEVRFSYNSQLRLLDTPYGKGWQFSYGLNYFVHSNGDISILRGDGRLDTFTESGGTYTPPAGITDTLEEYLPGQFRLSTKRGIRFYFDNATHKTLTSMTESNGNTLTFTYNPSDLLTTITDASGRVVTLTYGGNNKVSTITDPAGRVWTYAYDVSGNLISVTDPLTNVTTYSYGTNSRLTGITDPNGNTTTFSYNTFSGFGEGVGSVISGGSTYTMSYNPTTKTATVTDALGRQTIYTYDSYTNGRVIQVEDPLGNNASYTWNGNNFMTTVIDKNGNQTDYTYDAGGNVLSRTEAVGTLIQRTTTYTYEPTYNNVTSVTDPELNTTTYTYDIDGNLTSVTDPLGNTTTHTYDGVGQRTSTTDPNGNIAIYTYDAYGHPTGQTIDPGGLTIATSSTFDIIGNRLTSTDANGNTTAYTYDGLNRLITVTDALLNSSSYTYDADGNRLTETDANGNTTTYSYDSLNRVTAVTDPLSNTTLYSYDAVGNRTKVTDANGKVTCYVYDQLNRNTSVVWNVGDTSCTPDMDDAVSSTVYDAVGNRISSTDANGNTTTYVYDELNQRISVMNPMGETTSYTYYPDGQQETVTTPGGNVTTNTYDAADRLTDISDSLGTVATYTYDANGNRLTSTDGNGFTTTSIYDAANRLVSVTDPLSNSLAYSYDDVGNQITITDRNGNTTSYTYDALNRRIMTTDALLNLTVYIYDPVGNLTIITDAKGNVTSYTYDALNRLLMETYADLTSRSFTYDAVGNMLTRTDQNGVVTSYTYDDLYRLTLRNYPGANDDAFTYDEAGRMLTAANTDASIAYTYDNANRILSETLNGKVTSYAYDIPNRKRTLTYPGGKSVTEEMDLRSLLDNITEGLNTIALYSYDPGNRVVARDYLNTTTATYTYNANNWTINLTHLTGITAFADFEYTFDNEGNRKYQKKYHFLTNSEQYLYDNIYRVTGYKEGTLDGSGTVPAPLTQTAYNYDAVGNRTTTDKDSLITTYTTNNVNEYTSIVDGGTINPLHDANGNLTSDGTKTFTYDYENRLVSVSPGGIAYKYDPLGRRIEKNVSGTITRYFFDGSRVIEERDGSDVVVATYVFGIWIDEILTMERGGNTYYYYHQNSLGSVAAVTDSAGVVVERYEYDAYGNASVFDGSYTPLIGSAIGNPYMFTGREYDIETGFYYYRARYYDPAWGRFLQRDPLGYVDGMNLYEYVRGNTLNWTDPDGLKVEICQRPMNGIGGVLLLEHAYIRINGWSVGFYSGPKVIIPEPDELKKPKGLTCKEARRFRPYESVNCCLEKYNTAWRRFFYTNAYVDKEVSCCWKTDEEIEECIKEKAVKLQKSPPRYNILCHVCGDFAQNLLDGCCMVGSDVPITSRTW